MLLPIRSSCSRSTDRCYRAALTAAILQLRMIREGGMARGEIRPGRSDKADRAPARARPGSGERRSPTPVEHSQAPPQPQRSDGMRLAAEVERLERELAAARSQMADL